MYSTLIMAGFAAVIGCLIYIIYLLRMMLDAMVYTPVGVKNKRTSKRGRLADYTGADLDPYNMAFEGNPKDGRIDTL